MKVDANSRKGRIGVTATALKFQRLGWLFRELPTDDYGIDAHVEIVENENPTGALIALQIKSGKSWFKDKNKKGFVFRDSRSHFDYWLNYSIPVIIVLYSEENDISNWQLVNKDNVTRLEKNCKITIPFNQNIDKEALLELKGISFKLFSPQDHDILKLQDVSHGKTKRYSVDILINKEMSETELSVFIKDLTHKIRNKSYYRSMTTENKFKSQTAKVVFLFIYASMADFQQGVWICKSQWIDSSLASDVSPAKYEGSHIDNETVVVWNKGFDQQSKFYQGHTVHKEIYLSSISQLLNEVIKKMEDVIALTKSFEAGSISEEKYNAKMKNIEPCLTSLYNNSNDIGIAPFECLEVSKKFQALVSTAHNTALFYSDKFHHENKHFFRKKAIATYPNDLSDLLYELEKIR